MPYPSSLVAYAFVKKGIAEGRPVTQMKLQKMVYFAHGYYLCYYGEPLVDEDFEAWEFGPVISNIYHNYKSFGRSPIVEYDNRNLNRQLEVLKKDEKAVEALEYTWNVTKGLSAATLSKWTHKQGSPWAAVYSANVFSVPMDNIQIEKYFRKFFENISNTQQLPAQHVSDNSQVASI